VLVRVILLCEVGFWVLLALGLLARYGFRLRRTSAVLLASVPVVDLVLLVVTTIDLQRGGVATAAHGLAAAYIAFSVVFGHRTIRAVDARVAHRFAGGPRPVRPATPTGPAAARAAWDAWVRGFAAWSIATALLGAAVLLVGDPARTRALVDWIAWLSTALGAWLLLGPVAARLTGRRIA
jgi:hypothetical protein